MRRFLLLIVVIFAASCLPDESTGKKDKIVFSQQNIRILYQDPIVPPADLTVEIADTNEKRMRGLMYRTAMPDNAGMLFLFPVQKRISMWMANTPLSLDMIFIDAQGKILEIVENTVPFSHDEIYSSKKAKSVLEVKSGISKKLNLHAGDVVEHPFFKK